MQWVGSFNNVFLAVGETDRIHCAVMSIQTLQELLRMEAMKKQKVQEDQSDTSMVTEKESMCNIIIVHCYIQALF